MNDARSGYGQSGSGYEQSEPRAQKSYTMHADKLPCIDYQVQAVFQTCDGADQRTFAKDWAARDPDAEEVAIISARAALKKFQADRVLIVERDTVSTVDSAMQMQIDTASSPLSTSLSQSRGAAGTRRQAGQGEGPT